MRGSPPQYAREPRTELALVMISRECSRPRPRFFKNPILLNCSYLLGRYIEFPNALSDDIDNDREYQSSRRFVCSPADAKKIEQILL